jgi:hypothetical protein
MRYLSLFLVLFLFTIYIPNKNAAYSPYSNVWIKYEHIKGYLGVSDGYVMFEYAGKKVISFQYIIEEE